MIAERAHRAVHDPELERAERQRGPARLVGEHPVVDERVEHEADPEHQRRRARPATSVCSAERDDEHRQAQRGASRDSRRPLSVYDIRARAGSAGGVLRARERVGGRERPLARRRRRARACASSSVSAGTVESGASTIQPSCVSSSCSSTSRRAAGRAAKPAPEAGRADDLLGSRSPGARRGTVPRARAARAARPTRGPAGTTERAARAAGRALLVRERVEAASPRCEKSGRGTLSGRRTGSRRRTETTSRPPRARSATRSPPPCPAPTTSTSRVLVRLVGVHGARVGRSSSGHARPGWPVATRTCRNGPSPSSSKPPSTARMRSTRCARKLCSQPLRARTRSTCARNSVDRRVVAVATRRDERPGRARRRRVAHRQAGERRRQAVAVALGAHPPLPDRLGARRATPRPGRRRVPKTAISLRSTPPRRSVA